MILRNRKSGYDSARGRERVNSGPGERRVERTRATFIEVAVVLLVGAAVFLPNLGQEVSLKKNEARHAEIARNMLRTGQYAVPYTCGKLYIDKPPLYNWAVAALSYATDRADLLMARLASALSAILAALATYILGRRWFSPRAGVFAAVMWITSWMAVEWGRFARMDMMMAALILCGVLLADMAAAAQGRRRTALWLAACLTVGLSSLTKNLLVLFFFAPAAVAIWRARQGRWLMPIRLAVAGLLVSILPYAIWAAAAEMARPGHLAAMWNYQGGEGIVEHPGGIAVYLVGLPAQTLPWVAFIGGAAYLSYRRLRRWGFDPTVIPAFTTLVCLVLISIMPSKRPHYALPMLPFWMLWLGGFVDEAVRSRAGGQGAGTSMPGDMPWWAFELPLGGALIGLVGFLGWGIAYWVTHAYLYKVTGALIGGAVALGAAAGAMCAFRHRFGHAVHILFGSLVALAVAGYPVFLPGLNRPAPEYAAADEIARMIPTDALTADYDVRDALVNLKLNRSLTFPESLDTLREFIGKEGRRYILVNPKHVDEVIALSNRPVTVLASWSLKDLACAILEAGPADAPSVEVKTRAEEEPFQAIERR